MASASPRRIALALATAVTAVSSAATFILIAEPLLPSTIAALRVAITGVALIVLGRTSLAPVTRTLARNPRLAGRVVLAAALLALHFGAWIASLSMTSVVRSVALVSTQPLFAGVLGHIIGDRAPARLYLGAVIAVAGATVMVAPALAGDPSASAVGDILALVGAVAAAGYLVIGRSVKSELPLPGYLALIHCLAAVMLIAIAVPSAGPIWHPEAGVADLLALAYLGLIPGVVGHGLLNWAVRHVPVHTVSLVILLEPVGAAALAWVALGRAVGPLEALGAAILLGGVGVGLPRQKRQIDTVARA